MCEVEIRVHLDHFPAAITVFIDADEQTGVVLFTPLDVEMSCLSVTRDYIPEDIMKNPTRDEHLIKTTRSLLHIPSLIAMLLSVCGYLFLSSGSAGMALCSGASSSS